MVVLLKRVVLVRELLMFIFDSIFRFSTVFLLVILVIHTSFGHSPIFLI